MVFVKNTNNTATLEEDKNKILNLNDKEKHEKLDKAEFAKEVITVL